MVARTDPGAVAPKVLLPGKQIRDRTTQRWWTTRSRGTEHRTRVIRAGTRVSGAGTREFRPRTRESRFQSREIRPGSRCLDHPVVAEGGRRGFAVRQLREPAFESRDLVRCQADLEAGQSVEASRVDQVPRRAQVV